MRNDLLQLILIQTWQIAVSAIGVAIAIRLFAKSRPHLAHALWMLVLVKCVTPPVWGHSFGLFSQLQVWYEPVTAVYGIASVKTPDTNQIAVEGNRSGSQADVDRAEFESSKMVVPGFGRTVDTGTDTNDRDGSVVSKDSAAGETHSPEAEYGPVAPGVAVTDQHQRQQARDAAHGGFSWPAFLAMTLSAGTGVTFLTMIARCIICLRMIQRHRTVEFDQELNEQVRQLAKQLRMRHVPRVIISEVLFGPAVFGFLKHTIVLPACLLKAERSQVASDGIDNPVQKERTDTNLSTLAPILAHELLHIRRGDLRTGTLQAIAQSLWWFHPAVWLSNRWLSREAERCCDEQVIAELGCSPINYARCLLSVIECKHELRSVPVFPGMKPVEITSQRMERIMSLKDGLRKQTPLWYWPVVTVLAVVLLPGAIAQTRSQNAIVPTSSVTDKEPQNTTAVETQLLFRSVPEHVRQSSDPLVKLVWDAHEVSRHRLALTDRQTPWHLMQGLLALRRDFILRDDDELMEPMSWLQNVPKAGRQPWFLKTAHGGQPNPSPAPIWFDEQAQEFVAALAMCDVSRETEFVTPDGNITMADMVHHLQMTLTDTNSSSFTLVVLSHYLAPDATWTNAMGEVWSVETLVELISRGKRIQEPSTLFALAYARNKYRESGKLFHGVWLEADTRIQTAIQTARNGIASRRRLQSTHFPARRMPHFVPTPVIPTISVLPGVSGRRTLSVRQERNHEWDISKEVLEYEGMESNNGKLLSFLTLALSDRELEEDWFRRALSESATELLISAKESVIKAPFYEVNQALGIYLERKSKQTSPSQAPGVEPLIVQVKGRIKTPGSMTAPEGADFRVLDVVALAGGAIDESTAMVSVIRRGAHDSSLCILRASLQGIQRGTEPNLHLAVGDEVLIGSPLLVDRPLKEMVRLDDQFVLSTDVPISGSTKIVSVNNKPVTVESLLGARWKLLQQLSELNEDQRREVALSIVRGELSGFVFDELVLQHFNAVIPTKTAEVDETGSAGRLALLRTDIQQQREKIKAETPGSLFAVEIGLVRANEDSERQRDWVVEGYESALSEAELSRARSAVSKHCQEMLLNARLRTKISLNFENKSLTEVVEIIAREQNVNLSISTRDMAVCSRVYGKPGTVTFQSQNRPLEESLRQIVEPFGLTILLDGITVMIQASDPKLSMQRFRMLSAPPSYAVYGVVKTAGWQPLTKEIRLLDAIDLADGISDASGVVIEITSPAILEGKAMPVSMSLRALRNDKTEKLNRIIQDGDMIDVIRPEDTMARRAAAAESLIVAAIANESAVIKEASNAVVCYSVADLIVPLETNKHSAPESTGGVGDEATRAIRPAPERGSGKTEDLRVLETTEEQKSSIDFAPLIALLKATIEPDSWAKDDAAIVGNAETLSLVVRQTAPVHQKIEELLSQLRKAQDQNVQISCRLATYHDETQRAVIEKQCELHPLRHGMQWALLTSDRDKALWRSLSEAKLEVLAAPRILTIDGQSASVHLGQKAPESDVVTGFRLEVTPRLIQNSPVIRLRHSILIGDLSVTMPAPIESLVGSGQTLLLLVEDSAAAAESVTEFSGHVLLITPEHVDLSKTPAAVQDSQK